MVRRIASQVHKQVSRLMRADFIKKEPVWYKAVLDYPPLPLPPKAPPERSDYDLAPRKQSSSSKMRPVAPKPLPIHYLEDDIRRQFYRDHPFEAFRPKSLVEGETIQTPHPMRGEQWTRLRQRGRNPSPEDAIEFVINLYRFHNVPLSEAYSRSVAQFRALQSGRHVAATYASLEADHLGAIFGPSEIEHGFMKEKRSLETWERREELDEGAMAARKRWKSIFERQNGGTWSRGAEYVRLWKDGVRPTYAPVLTEPEQPVSPSPEDIAASPDFMQTLTRR
ncbi:mitochondrial ribosomal small subunit component [Pleurotus pulmonarius]|nr:mitochondrial ribosomal small subunit component [Pleurotus pulmonarius]KAF4606508.1 mitochondrial ribosomal small subunit component [Pleurotus pulmonarius]